ncbi:MAG: GH3 auxin-responsive promoter family protein, partial [Microcoleus sp. T3-bin5]|nr:GH3 auxin-responsive promoter family protein [Microcoleus sp. T3-bin5]
MVNLVQSIGTAAARQIKANFVRKTRQTSAVQEQFLLSLLSTYQNTELGQKYGLSQIKTVDQFRERIPILPYSSYEPYLERIAEGETNILTPDPVVYLSLTSGTTSKKKLIPVTKRSRSVRNRANRASMSFAVDAARQWGRPLGQMLLTSSVQLAGRTSAGIEYGPVSVGELRSADFLSRQLFAYPYEILQIADSLAHHYLCLLFA